MHGMGSVGVEGLEEVQADAGEVRGGTGGLQAGEDQGDGGESPGGPELAQGHKGVVVGDGFREVFRKVARAGRRKVPPDGKIQQLMTNFMSLGGIGENILSRNFGGTGSKRKLTAEAPSAKKGKFS